MSAYNPPRDNDGNHRVTNAVIQNEIKHLTEEVRSMCGKMDRRMAQLEELLHVETSDLRARCQENATQVARLDERQKATTGIMGGLTFVFSAIAAAIGSLVK